MKCSFMLFSANQWHLGILGDFVCDLGKPLRPLFLTLNIPNDLNEFNLNAFSILCSGNLKMTNLMGCEIVCSILFDILKSRNFKALKFRNFEILEV